MRQNASTNIHITIDAGSRWVAHGRTGDFWVEQVRISPIGWKEWSASLRGQAIKKDGTGAFFQRDGECDFDQLPQFVQELIVAQLHQHIDALKEYTRQAQFENGVVQP